ncbi:hypothetical protein J6590_006386 [Homalodisca vitripennis]|nr:hypothetical protein J6590_006386 [Homalodisca vitripennis]
MDNAELYAVYNSMQKKDTQKALAEFMPRFSWSEDEMILDVGCGPGDVTAEVLYPYLPSSARLVGVDINPKMVEYANKKYSSRSINFKQLDFSTKNITEVFHERTFSKLFSFYCLHWIQDQQQTAKNIWSVLQPGGQFLILMSPKNAVFKVYQIMSQMDKWKSYMKDLDDFIPYFYNSADPCEEIKHVLTSQGLDVHVCEERLGTVSFPNRKIHMRSNEAVNPFVKRMNQDTREQFMASFEQVVEENQLFKETISGEILAENHLIVVYGRRPLVETCAEPL